MMNFKILFFAGLRDEIGFDNIKISLDGKNMKVADIVSHLCETNLACRAGFEVHNSWQVAVNKELVNVDAILNTDDEIAFFPPFSGG